LAYWYIRKNDNNYHFPEGGYPGDFAKSVSEEIQREYADEIDKLKDEELIEFFIRHGLELVIRKLKEDIEKLGIHFDRWVYESDFINSGASQKVVEKFKAKGNVKEKEGAVWFSSPEYSDFSDRESVLVRSDTSKLSTYFATDIAYHEDKLKRGYELLIDIWGANHHGHIVRMKAALAALGYAPDKLRVILYQNVRLKKGGEIKQMGKRLGNFITVSDLIEKMKIPASVFKFMIISQSSASIIDFDLDLAREQSEKNPLYYLQYAYARICSILRKVPAKNLVELEKIARGEASIDSVDLEILQDKKELKLIKELVTLPEQLKKIASDFQIQSLPHFTTQIARSFHDFYTSCKVLSDNKKLTTARLLLILATRNVLKISLTLMGIEALEKM